MPASDWVEAQAHGYEREICWLLRRNLNGWFTSR
jgi:hypothetical protein